MRPRADSSTLQRAEEQCRAFVAKVRHEPGYTLHPSEPCYCRLDEVMSARRFYGISQEHMVTAALNDVTRAGMARVHFIRDEARVIWVAALDKGGRLKPRPT